MSLGGIFNAFFEHFSSFFCKFNRASAVIISQKPNPKHNPNAYISFFEGACDLTLNITVNLTLTLRTGSMSASAPEVNPLYPLPDQCRYKVSRPEAK